MAFPISWIRQQLACPFNKNTRLVGKNKSKYSGIQKRKKKSFLLRNFYGSSRSFLVSPLVLVVRLNRKVLVHTSTGFTSAYNRGDGTDRYDLGYTKLSLVDTAAHRSPISRIVAPLGRHIFSYYPFPPTLIGGFTTHHFTYFTQGN